MADTPTGRKRKVSGTAHDVNKKEGSAFGSGPVGGGSSYSGRPKKSDRKDGEKSGLTDLFLNAVSTNTSSSSSSGSSSGGGLFQGKGLLILIVIAVLVFGGGGLSGLFGNLLGGTDTTAPIVSTQPLAPTQGGSSGIGSLLTSYSSLGGLSSLFGGSTSNTSYSGFSGASTSSGWTTSSNTAKLNTNVDPAARAKRTTILGNKRDVITMMVYMCGADLESQNGMATSDLSEMAKATISDNINLIVYTGGCSRWKVNGISGQVNQIWQIKNGQLHQLSANAGTGAMTDPKTLKDFIIYCKNNFQANRNVLIFWDHGGGSISGYGYDERVSGSGSMGLSGIQSALKSAGMTFDFIGFDTCLMATAENALMLSEFADYLVASEETEPGIGWYYTNWLNKLSANTSMSTLEIGKNIVDDFVDTCAKSCAGQKATLSVIDLAELEKTLPSDLKDFASNTSSLIQSDYKTVSNARSSAREFATTSRIDQVDLVDLANKIGTDASRELADTLLSAIKYNRTSTNMTNAYGLSIYFPYQRISTVDSAAKTYKAIGMDSEYTRCIQAFASVETGGQAISGGSSSALSSLLSGFSSGGQTATSSDMVSSILGGLLGGNFNGVSGLSSLTNGFLGSVLGKSLDRSAVEKYLVDNRFDTSALEDWILFEDNRYGIAIKDDQWKLVQKLELNVWLKDKDGYIDLGLDNVYEINQYGVLRGEYDYSWLAIDDYIVPYYLMDTVDDGTNYSITGRVPVKLNGQLAELILVFDNAHEDGYIAGVRYVYNDSIEDTELAPIPRSVDAAAPAETATLNVDGQEVIVEGLNALQDGDEIRIVCNHYKTDGSFDSAYELDYPTFVVGKAPLKVSTQYLSDRDKQNAEAVYLFTDIYQQKYWTPVIPQ